MRRKSTILLLVFLGLFCLKESDAATFNSVNDGNWSDPATWDLNTVPGINDDVIINGHQVTIDNSTYSVLAASELSINSLTISGSTGTGGSLAKLLIGGVGKFSIQGDVSLYVSDNTKTATLTVGGMGSELDISGNIYFYANSIGRVFLKVRSNAIIKLAGNVNRSNGFGSIIMDDATSIEFDGNNTQSIPTHNTSGDTTSLSNIIINNAIGITLTEPFVVKGELTLAKGNIISSDANPVIVGDMASIIGGSDEAYIEGPVQKLGRTDGSEFTFPIGNATTYAPITISAVSNVASEFTAIYEGDPPPFGLYENSIDRIDETQHWALTKTAGSDDVTVSLNWQDGAASNLSHIDSVIVVGLRDEGTPAATWVNYGQQSATGSISSGESGTVASLDGDPPPFGVFKFTVGSGVPTASLPVELIKFGVQEKNEKAKLFWKTASEVNSELYQIERSIDGINFNKIGFVRIVGDSETLKDYQYTDAAPAKGVNYYRLKIVDLDGSFEYSDIVTLNLSNEPIIVITPNPVVDIININTGKDSDFKEAIIEIFDQAGTRLGKRNINLNEGKTTVSISELNITSTGVYYMRITGNSSSKVLRFIKVD